MTIYSRTLETDGSGNVKGAGVFDASNRNAGAVYAADLPSSDLDAVMGVLHRRLSGQFAQIIFRVVDQDNWWRASVGGSPISSSQTADIRSRTGGSFDAPAASDSDTGFLDATSYDLRVRCSGTSISFTDATGAISLATASSLHQSGKRVGMILTAGSTGAQDFRIHDIETGAANTLW